MAEELEGRVDRLEALVRHLTAAQSPFAASSDAHLLYAHQMGIAQPFVGFCRGCDWSMLAEDSQAVVAAHEDHVKAVEAAAQIAANVEMYRRLTGR